MATENNITWEDKEGDPFFSQGTCKEINKHFVIEQQTETPICYALLVADIPEGAGDDFDKKSLVYEMADGGEAHHNEEWARGMAKRRAIEFNPEHQLPTPPESAPTNAGDGNTLIEPTPSDKTAPAPDSPHSAQTQGNTSLPTPPVGHNGVDAVQLKGFAGRIETLTGEKSEIEQAIKDVYAEAKAYGYDAPTLKKCVKERRKDPAKRQEADDLFSLYAEVLL